MTAYALFGLIEAKAAGYDADGWRLSRGATALVRLSAQYPRAVPDLEGYGGVGGGAQSAGTAPRGAGGAGSAAGRLRRCERRGDRGGRRRAGGADAERA